MHPLFERCYTKQRFVNAVASSVTASGIGCFGDHVNGSQW